MLIRIKFIKHFLVFIIMIFTCLAFPIQVIYMSPLPSLIPYMFFAVLILFYLFSKSKSYFPQLNSLNQIDVVIATFFILVNLSTLINFLFGLINYADVLTVYVIYVFPILFYVYFSHSGSDSELKIILRAIYILGIINAIYYVYDNYHMVVIGEVSSFSLRMYEYSNLRNDGGTVAARIWAFNRGHGLLERHSVSSAWIAIGSFAYLANKPYISLIKRSLLIVLTLLTLLITMNFTSFVGYIMVITLFEINLIQLFYLRIYLKSFKKIFYLIVLTILIIIPVVMLIGDTFNNYLIDLLLSQIQLGIGNIDYANSTYLRIIQILKKRKIKISFAESCTGGMLASAITSVSGSSKVFTLGLVAYSNQSKTKVLKVSKNIIRKYRSVSEQVCLAMVKNVNKIGRTNMSVAITGIAGPSGGTKIKPVGLVYVGMKRGNKVEVKKYLFKNKGRSYIQKAAVNKSLGTNFKFSQIIELLFFQKHQLFFLNLNQKI